MHDTLADLLDKIEMRFIEGDYDKPNGLKLFTLDIQEAKESHIQEVAQLKDEITRLEDDLLLY